MVGTGKAAAAGRPTVKQHGQSVGHHQHGPSAAHHQHAQPSCASIAAQFAALGVRAPPCNTSAAERQRLLRYEIARLPPSPNHTIAGNGLVATVFLPDAKRGYYRSSRYDWGSMVGHVVLQVPNGRGNVTLCTSVRPRPHRPLATDHVIGLAAEFGCGVRGALCHASGKPLASNGVLGYGDAGRGGTFLKLGVGKLLRPAKLRADGYAYNFSWPYEFAEPPLWDVQRLDGGRAVVLQQSVRYRRWGWAIRRKISACGHAGKRPALCVDMRLTNMGTEGLRTPYASGHAFNMLRGPATGPGFGVTFSTPGSARYHDHGVVYNANGTKHWATPLAKVAELALRVGVGQSRITVTKRLTELEYASANFGVNASWDGRFAVTLPAAAGWNLVVRHSMWRDEAVRRSGWFGFNLRISRRAVAPRPYSLLDLAPGESASVTHRYEFEWRPMPPKPTS